MRVRLLGTAAGGGFPQWNCNCANCHGVRTGTLRARPRTQSCAAISADGRRWFLLNASPDIRFQIEAFTPLLPPTDTVRGTRLEGILLTNADLDHVLGLLVLREGLRLTVHATPRVRYALSEGLGVASTLTCYCGLDLHEPPAGLSPLLCADGSPSGLSYAALPVPGKPPRYLEGRVSPAPGDVVAYRFVDETTGGRLLFMPDVAALDGVALSHMSNCEALLFDGTFWSEDEMQVMGVGTTPAAKMGHLPVGGPDGSLNQIASLPVSRRIYVHINNTNPILIEDSVERLAVESAGVEVGSDGLEFTL
jgi:pyrroloquinoline quinone biosynthesis protein B